MTEDSVRQNAESMAAGSGRPEGSMVTCPMAKMCAGMTQKRLSGVLTMLPGIFLIVLGVLIVIEPAILIWLVAAASVLMGIMLLLMGSFMRKMSAQLRM